MASGSKQFDMGIALYKSRLLCHVMEG